MQGQNWSGQGAVAVHIAIAIGLLNFVDQNRSISGLVLTLNFLYLRKIEFIFGTKLQQQQKKQKRFSNSTIINYRV